MANSDSSTPASAAPRSGTRSTEFRYEHTPNFVHLLVQLHASLLVSTYQAGKLLAIGVYQGSLAFSFHGFEQVMGVAVRPGLIAVGSRRQVWFLRSAPDLAPQIAPPGKHDACFLTRSSHLTGEIHGHEMAWSRGQGSGVRNQGSGVRGQESGIRDQEEAELWVVNTLFSCLCTLKEEYSFVPRWRPPFVTALAGEDRCHLNGLAMEAGKPKYVTALAETDTPAGWRPTKANSGCLIDVARGATVARGLAMPHSPRLYDGRAWLLNSGRGQLAQVDVHGGRVEPVAQLSGYTRGLAIHGPFAFVGLSKIRETNVFGGLPIAESAVPLKCGVAVVDLRNGRQVAALDFQSGVDEIFDVQVLPGIRFPALTGPDPAGDGNEIIWLAPPQVPFS